MKNSQNSEDAEGGSDFAFSDDALFGFDDDSWFGELRVALVERSLGKIGGHELVAEAGRGGQGVVYKARQAGTGREIAIKRMLGGSLATPSARRRFEREVEVIESLRHPGIVTLYGVEEVSEVPLLLMEWVEGEVVTDWAAEVRRRFDRADPRDAARMILKLFASIGDAVQYAHQNGVIHRDIKPSNVLVTHVRDDDQVRVLDFGLAKFLEPTPSDTDPTRTGFLGTPAYAAPEQLDGRPDLIDARSDGYSLGVLLYEMLTGDRPYASNLGLRQLLDQIDQHSALAPSRRVPGLDRDVDAIVLKAMSARPEDRYPAVGTMIDDVRRYLDGGLILASPQTTADVLRRLMRRHRWVALVSALLVTCVIGFSVLAIYQALETERERERATREAATLRAVLDFVVDDLLMSSNPVRLAEDPPVSDVLMRAAERVGPALAGQPDVELRVRWLIGQSLFHSGHEIEAAQHMARAVELVRELHPLDAAAVGAALSEYGALLARLGELEEAERYLLDAMETLRPDLPRLGRDYLSSLQSLVSIKNSRGDAEGARTLALERLESLQGAEPSDPEEKAIYHFDFALLLDHAGEDERAQPNYEAAVDEMAAHPERFRGEIGFVLTHLASLYLRQDDLPRAETTVRRALDADREVLGDAHPDVGEHMSKLANIMRSTGRAEEAESWARRGLKIVSATVDGPSHRLVYAELALARVLKDDVGDLSGAEQHFERSLELLQALYGPDHPAEQPVREWLAQVKAAQATEEEPEENE